jgi:transposase-like protein
MPKRNYTPEQIINSLREAEVLLSQGNTASEAARHLGISEQTYYKWRKEYGGMRINQAKRLKELEKENARLWIMPYLRMWLRETCKPGQAQTCCRFCN